MEGVEHQRLTVRSQRRLAANLVLQVEEPLENLFVNSTYKWGTNHEWPIWGPLLSDVGRHSKANEAILSNEDLLEFLKEFFAEWVVKSIEAHLENTGESWLGSSYTRRGVFYSFVHHLVRNIVDDLTESDQITPEGEGWKKVQYRKKGKNQDDPNDRGMRGNIGAGGGRPGAGRGGAGRGGGRSGGRSDGGPYEIGSGGRRKFQDMEVREIHLSRWITPEKLYDSNLLQKRHRNHTIRIRSEVFINHPDVHEFSLSSYDPFTSTGAQPYVYLYHGTRSSRMPLFFKKGIEPEGRRTEFGRGELFYVTNSLRVAYEHPLHNHVNMHVKRTTPTRTGKTMDDTVAIYCFRVATAVLHSEQPELGYKFSTYWFENPDDKWQTFCQYNWGNTTLQLAEFDGVRYDFIMGPMSIPAPRGRPFDALRDSNGNYPLQIAFVSTEAKLWLANSLCTILLEVRDLDGEGNQKIHESGESSHKSKNKKALF